MSAVTLFSVAGCTRHGTEVAEAERPVVVVSVTTPRTVVRERVHVLSGTVRATDRAVVSARVAGTVVETRAEVGRAVSAGEELVLLKADELVARREQARASLSLVERELERERRLLEAKATTAEAVRTLEDRRRVAEAAVEEASTLASYLSVRAPFAGRVTRRHVESGDLALAGGQLFELERGGEPEVEVAVPESLPDPDGGAGLEVEARGVRWPAVVKEDPPAADPATRTRRVVLALPAAAAASAGAVPRSGEAVRVRWPGGVEPVVVVERSVLRRFGHLESVFVVNGGRVELRLVRTTEEVGDPAVIQSGLRVGEQVVVDPAPGLMEGVRVEVRR